MQRASVRRVVIQAIVACLVVGGRMSIAHGAQAQVTMPADDRARLVEAFRLADAIGDRLWTGWSTAPFAVLLVTPEREFLVRHPRPSGDFVAVGTDPQLGGSVLARPRQFEVGLLASFPAVGGVPTIVIGQPANTAAKRSTAWVLTMLHEHFHQWQTSQPGYYDRVNALGLARGDTSGGWMLNYAFPYGETGVQVQFAAMCARLNEALQAPGSDRGASVATLRAYLEAKRALAALVSGDDYRYMNFQLWQEGVSRYTELLVADLATAGYTPSAAFAALPDVTRYASEGEALRHRLAVQLGTVKLGEMRRTAFYAVGAAEALLLDRLDPSWRERYTASAFSLDGLLETAARP